MIWMGEGSKFWSSKISLGAGEGGGLSFEGKKSSGPGPHLHSHKIRFCVKYVNKEAIWLYTELFWGHHDSLCHGLWWFVAIHVMLSVMVHGSLCHGLWWFVVTHVMVNLWWFIVICGDLWCLISSIVVVHVMVCGGSIENSLKYWPKHAVLVKTWGCYPSFWSSRKVNPTLWRFRANPSRIDGNIDQCLNCIILSSCENWLSGTAKILLQMDFLNQSNLFEKKRSVYFDKY